MMLDKRTGENHDSYAAIFMFNFNKASFRDET